MSILRHNPALVEDRPSVLIELKLVDKLGLPLDASIAWQALLIAFKDHPHLQIYQAKISPDKQVTTNV